MNPRKLQTSVTVVGVGHFLDDTQVKVEVPGAGLHQPLKAGRGIGQSKGHSIALIESQWPHGKCNQWFALLVHLTCQYPDLMSSKENHWDP